MKKLILIVPILIFALVAPSMADSLKTITLQDGSTIHGRITGIDNGHYVVTSPSVGEVRIKESDILSITAPGVTVTSSQPDPTASQTNAINYAPLSSSAQYSSQMQNVQSQLFTNPALMADMQKLTEDPAVIAALNDPAFVQAVQSGNLQAVQSSPQLQRLMASPRMQDLIQKIRPQSQP
ncbi:MAG: hypothetical protein HGA80_07895 [Candidatus Omnitrophica bacterium]|nr:hypothetical protein [Candidatus Omnitrophota bacterium]